MNKLLFFLLLIISTPFESFAQDTLWTRTFGGDDEDYGRCVKHTSDGGFIVVGDTRSFGAGQRDIYLIKTDSYGDTLWTRLYGEQNWDESKEIQETTDGGFIIAGHTESHGSGERDIYLIKTNPYGDTLWTRTYGGPLGDYAESVQQTADGGYIVTGWTESPSHGSRDVFLMKTDASGDTLWTHVWGDSLAEYAYSVRQTLDGGYVITGGTASFGAGSMDVFLIKTDSSGKVLLKKTYGGSGFDWGFSVRQTSDGGYVITGEYSHYLGNSDVYLIRTDSSGDTLWTRTYGELGFDHGKDVQLTSDGDIIITGFTQSWGAVSTDVLLLKTDSDGNLLWVQTYGGPDGDWGYSIDITPEGDYIITGLIGSTDYHTQDIYLIRVTDSSARIDGLREIPSIPRNLVLSQNYPNPFNPSTTILYEVAGTNNKAVDLTVFDVRGRSVRTLVERSQLPGRYEIRWDGKDNHGQVIPSGSYLYRLRVGDHVLTRRMSMTK